MSNGGRGQGQYQDGDTTSGSQPYNIQSKSKDLKKIPSAINNNSKEIDTGGVGIAKIASYNEVNEY